MSIMWVYIVYCILAVAASAVLLAGALVGYLRDEAHRFGITFHRDLRSKSQIKSELDSIKGIGPTTASTLLRHFKSVARIKADSLQEITTIIGPAKAKLVKAGLEQNELQKN